VGFVVIISEFWINRPSVPSRNSAKDQLNHTTNQTKQILLWIFSNSLNPPWQKGSIAGAKLIVYLSFHNEVLRGPSLAVRAVCDDRKAAMGHNHLA
jgi:hypothetical protein